VSKAQVDDEFDDIIDFAEVKEFVNTPYKHLSSGMKVRVAFSVVSRLDEPILLVDEVLAVGDRGFRRKCYARIEEMLDEGRTLFFVSHSDGDLKRFCKRGLYLDKGELQYDGPIGDAFERYSADYA
jgi:ABC-2 type transport system ATP-binding protein